MSSIQTKSIKGNSKWSFAAATYLLRRFARMPSRSLESAAFNSWEISPGIESISPPAFFLPNQLERVTNWAFSTEHPYAAMKGGLLRKHRATRGFLLKDVWLIDGSLYKGDAYSWLAPRERKFPTFRVENEIERGALYGTASGNKYFGQWLMDDCVAYPLAKDEGIPVTTAQPVNIHTLAYEDWLGMKPTRTNNTFFKELVLFDDIGQNTSKHLRFRAMSDHLLSHVDVKPHPGVFILRRGTGQLRLLKNEIELAEYLNKKRGFHILEAEKMDVPSIVRTCAGAQVVIGVEGSGLMHGILTLKQGGSILALQPPDRFVGLYKDLTDRDHQQFGFVVGQPEGQAFRIDPEEVERTLDLFPS